MVVGVEQNARKRGFESESFIVPEFGPIDIFWLDLNKKYRGAIFRLGQDAVKQVAEIVGFMANYELPGIRTALVDLCETQGYMTFEIERNLKPTDIAVRYSRERWTLLDTPGKSDTLRPWIKTEFEAKFISEKVIALVAEQLRLVGDNSGNFFIRINFKDKTFGLICEERFVEQMPPGGFSQFTLPTEAMLAVAMQAKQEGEQAEEHEQENTNSGSQNNEDILMETEEQKLDTSASSGIELQTPPSPAEAPEQVQQTTPLPPFEQNAVPAPTPVAPSEPAAAPVPTQEPELAASVEPVPTASSTPPISPTALRQPKPIEPHKSLEKFITRKEDRPVERERAARIEQQPVETSAKYATYSRSEVDQMMKQQAENIGSSLGSKIASQQRVFQESVERQEKTFAKLSDGFVVQFDQTRARLENISKQSEETIRTELDAFKKDLSKELESYRAQINKTVVPVAKFIEDKNKSPEKIQKEVAKAQKEQQPKANAQQDVYGLRPLLITNLVLVLIALGALFAVVMPDLERIQTLQQKVDELSSKLNPAAPSSHTTSGQSSGNLSKTTDTAPVSSGGN